METKISKTKEFTGTIERKLYILKLLKKGYTPNYVIPKIAEKYNIAEVTAKNAVYAINSELNKTNTELMKKAKDYIINTLLGVIEECNDVNDVKNKLMAIKQLSDVTKVTEEKGKDINIQFKFDK